MPSDITTADIISAIRLTADAPTVTAEIDRLRTVAFEMLIVYAPDAPLHMSNQAVTMIVDYLYNMPGQIQLRHPEILRASAALGVIAPWREGAPTLLPTEQRPGTDTVARIAAQDAQATADRALRDVSAFSGDVTRNTNGIASLLQLVNAVQVVAQGNQQAIRTANGNISTNASDILSLVDRIMSVEAMQEPPTDNEADAAVSNTIRGWAASKIRRVVESIVPAWARMPNAPGGLDGGVILPFTIVSGRATDAQGTGREAVYTYEYYSSPATVIAKASNDKTFVYFELPDGITLLDIFSFSMSQLPNFTKLDGTNIYVIDRGIANAEYTFDVYLDDLPRGSATPVAIADVTGLQTALDGKQNIGVATGENFARAFVESNIVYAAVGAIPVTVSITPTASNKRIMITALGGYVGTQRNNATVQFDVRRNGTTKVGDFRYIMPTHSSALPVSAIALDSPATTDEVTYNLHLVFVSNGFFRAGDDDPMMIEAREID